MEILIASVLFLIGLALIVKGGDVFVDAAAWMARASGLPQFIIGATIVSVATTLPEIIVSTLAAADLNTDIAIGNAVGSVAANTGLIMGMTLVFMPVAIARKQFSFKGILMVLSCVALYFLCGGGSLTQVESFLMLLLFAIFLAENVLHARHSTEEELPRRHPGRREITRNVILFLIGAGALVVGSRLLVDNGEVLAVALGVPDRIIGITLVAIGTSLPELVTAITAIVKRESSMSVGNILGANLIDITVILPLCAFISHGTLPVSSLNVALDIPICILETAVAVVPTIIFKKFSRIQGVLMVALYLAYLIYSIAL